MLSVLVKIVAMSKGIWLIHVFDKNISSSFYAVLAANFIELDSCYHLSTLPHVILHEGLARSCRIHCRTLWRKNFSLGIRCPPGRMRGVRKCSSPALSHHLRQSPRSRNKRVILWMMDSATSPFGFAQNDRVGGMLWRVKVLWLEKPTKREPGIMCIEF